MGEIKDQWSEIIRKKLKGGKTVEDLSFEYPGGIVLSPHLTKEETKTSNETTQKTSWINMANISGASSAEKNRMAHLALSYGAGGLRFNISEDDDLSIILNNIKTEFLDVILVGKGISKESIKKIHTYLVTHEIQNTTFISAAEISTLSSIESLSIDTNCKEIVMSVGKNILFEIAKLRALRQFLNTNNLDCKITATYTIEGENTLGDYNLIEKTYKIMAAILGGADYILTDFTENEDSRLTLNIHHILDLESGMKNVLDPVAGSYYIENLSAKIHSKMST